MWVLPLAAVLASPKASARPTVVVPIAIDEAASAGIAQNTHTYGAVVDDFNGDGVPDFLLGRHFYHTGQLFINDRAGHFNEADAKMFTTKDRHGCGTGDVNLDGRIDIACAVGTAHGTGFKSDELWIQQPGLTFDDQGSTSGMADPLGRSRRMAFIDANADGYPDLFEGDEGERPGGLPTYNRLFLNKQGQSFVPAPQFGLDGIIGNRPMVADYNGDGFDDLLLSATDDNSIALYRNDQGKGFTDVSAQVGISGDIGAFGTLVDLNGDGVLDMIEVLSDSLVVRIQESGVFQIAYTRALAGGRWMATGDVNGDQRPDVYIQLDKPKPGVGYACEIDEHMTCPADPAPDLMLLNDGDGTDFTEMSIPQVTTGQSDGVYPLDYDGNGLTDFLALNGGGTSEGPIELIAFFPPGPRPGGAPAEHAGHGSPGAASGASSRRDGDPSTAASPGPAAPPACGPSWRPVTLPERGLNPHGLAVASPNDVWAVGHRHGGGHINAASAHWGGSSWKLVDVPRVGVGDAGLNSVAALSSDDVWGVGFYGLDTTLSGEGSDYAPSVYHWTGAAWAPVTLPDVDSPSSSLTDVDAVSAGDIWAVGYRKVGVTFETLALHWDSTSWSEVSTPNVGTGKNVLTTVAAVSANDVWAAGWYFDGVAPKTLTEHWNGTSWSVVPSANVGLGANVLSGVAAVSSSNVWAVGFSQQAIYHTLIEHWDGSSWTVVASRDSGSVLNVLRSVVPLANNDVWVGGATYDATLGRYQTLSENWDGVGWTIVPTALTENPTQLEAMAAAADNDLWGIGSASESNVSQQNCPVQVLDSGFSPAGSDVGQGAGVAWSIPSDDAQSHSISDMSGMGLFDSGSRSPGSSFVYTYIGAGSYLVSDAATGKIERIQVPAQASPQSGGLLTQFTITWASTAPPSGYVFDVQIRRPGSSTWENWLSDQTVPSAQFTADAGTGVYRFRARMKRSSNLAHSGWSPRVLITVS